MSDPRTPWYQQLPTKAVAVVVFLVALTTLVGNIMGLYERKRVIAATEQPPKPVSSRNVESIVPPQLKVHKLRLDLDRIVVAQDGSPGTTDWRFTVEADGEPLFAFRQDDLDDTGGRNVAAPRDAKMPLQIEAQQTIALTVKGWRASRFRLPGTEPDVQGEGMMKATGTIAPIEVNAKTSKNGAFVFYFSIQTPEL